LKIILSVGTGVRSHARAGSPNHYASMGGFETGSGLTERRDRYRSVE
jgi:hypothetical protein